MKKKMLSWVICILILALQTSTLAGCKKAGSEIPTEEEAPTAAQKAAFLIPNGMPTDWESFKTFYVQFKEKLPEKQAELEAAASAAGLSENTYFSMLRNHVNIYLAAPDEIYNGINELKPEELEEIVNDTASSRYLFEMASAMCLMGWNELEDMCARPTGYVGLCAAICEGGDLFDIATDAKDLTGDGSWPADLFFGDRIPPLVSQKRVLLCDEYLQGYGMDDATICVIGSNEIKSANEAESYAQLLREKGLYIMSDFFNGTESMPNVWYGTWIGDDGTALFVYIEYVGPDCEEGSRYIETFAEDCSFLILASNFNFTQCANVAMEYYFG